MSKIIPSVVAETLRANTDTLVGYIGQDCTLHTVATRTTDKLRSKATTTYNDPVETQVLIHWSPEIRLLKALGLYVEGHALPILAYFLFADDPQVDDLFELEYEYAIGTVKSNHFKIVDRKLLGHDEEAKAVWVVAPARSWPL